MDADRVPEQDEDEDEEPEMLGAEPKADIEADVKQFIEHVQGRCKPCAFFGKRTGGCRMGDGCNFCHLPASEHVPIWNRHRKNQKQKQKR